METPHEPHDSDPEESAESEPDIDELDAADAADQKVQDIADERSWVDTCISTMAQGMVEVTCSDAVRSALDSLVITAAARAKRALRSDLARGKT